MFLTPYFIHASGLQKIRSKSAVHQYHLSPGNFVMQHCKEKRIETSARQHVLQQEVKLKTVF
ncbi:MAG: hypothetical protein V4805_04125 [Pseudomonadota bacterium]